MWELYDELLSEISENQTVTKVIEGPVWTAVETDSGNVGIAMTTARECVDRCVGSYEGLPLHKAAELVKSWNLREASVGMAAINAFLNTPERLELFDLRQKQDGHSTFGMDVAGRNVVMIGALRSKTELESRGAHVTVLEREEKPGTLPDSAAEFVIPGCDILVITASALINKTLPRLLELGRTSTIVLTGPSAPMSKKLLSFGISRVTGMTVTDTAAMMRHVADGTQGQPYSMGERFCIE